MHLKVSLPLVLHVTVFNFQTMTLHFITFKIWWDVSCFSDWMKLFNGPNVGSNKVWEKCGNNNPNNYQSSSNYLTLKFHSNCCINSQGAKWSWTSGGASGK